MLSAQMRTISVEEQALETLEYLATQVMNRPMLYGLIQSDVERWSGYSVDEKKVAVTRSIRRVGGVCPWVRTKQRVIEVMAAMSVGNA